MIYQIINEQGYSAECIINGKLELLLIKKLGYYRDFEKNWFSINKLVNDIMTYGKTVQKINAYNSMIAEMNRIMKDIRLVDIELYDCIYVRERNCRTKIYDGKKIDGIPIKTFRQLTRDLYNDVLPKVCKNCGSKERLEIHHLRYKYPLDIRDLVRLCRKCHSLVEVKKRGFKNRC